jgi:hypothetical protein
MSDMQSTLDPLEARIKSLEGFMTGLRWMVPAQMLMLLVLGSGVYTNQSRIHAMAQGVMPGSITADSLSLRNAKGDITVLVSGGANASASVVLFDAQKNVRVSIGLQDDGSPGVWLYDQGHNARAALSLNKDQDPSLVLFNAEKNVRALLGLDSKSDGVASLFGSAGGLNFTAAKGTVQWTPVVGSARDLPAEK